MPAAAGTPEYEKPELWLGTGNWHRGFCHATPRPLRGTSPRATFFCLRYLLSVRLRSDRSCRLGPAHQGMKKREWLGTAYWRGGFCHAPPRPQRGTSPRATFPPPHPWTPVLYRGTGVRQPGCPGWSRAGRRVCHSPRHPGGFVNRPYNDVCLWCDAGLGGLSGYQDGDRSDCEGARSNVDEAGVLNQPG